MTEEEKDAEIWRSIFDAPGNDDLKGLRKNYKNWPKSPRCRLCSLPFRGLGGLWMWFRGLGRSNRNRHYCNKCDKFIRAARGGAKVTMSVLFADVRNSVGLAAKLDPATYGPIIQNFTEVASETLMDADGFIVKFAGDAVAAVYPPGFLGRDEYARRAIEGAERLLRTPMPATPHGELTIGIGVSTGELYISTLRSLTADRDENRYAPSYFEVQPLGDVPNVAARLSGEASPGQALIDEATLIAAGYKPEGMQPVPLQLKGRDTPVTVCRISRDTPLLTG
jgi:adenylate cyclase